MNIKMKLYVDDVREAPDGWVRARTIREAMRMLATEQVVELSLDHDIAYFDANTKSTAAEDFLSLLYMVGVMPAGDRPARIYVHSANPLAYCKAVAIAKKMGVADRLVTEGS